MKKIAFAALAVLTMAGASSVFAAGSAPQPTICQRSCWGARAPKNTLTQMSSLNRAIIHHTAGSADYNTTSQSTSAALIRAIQNYHMDTNGWSDIGYHFLTDKLGNNFEGRSGSMTTKPQGAHDGVNTNSFGFNLMGYYHTPYNQTPTTVSRNAMYAVIAWRMPTGWSPYGSGSYGGRTVGTLAGHRDALSTACPGDLLYQYITTNTSGGEARNSVNALINGAPAVEVIVDNTSTGFSASTNWYTSTSTAGYYGTNYAVRPTASVSDPARWSVTLPSDGTYKVYARWTAGTNRPSAVSYQIDHTTGTATVSANQQANNGTWVQLGTWNFYQGTAERVRLSCWTTAGYYAVADAVRFVKQ